MVALATSALAAQIDRAQYVISDYEWRVLGEIEGVDHLDPYRRLDNLVILATLAGLSEDERKELKGRKMDAVRTVTAGLAGFPSFRPTVELISRSEDCRRLLTVLAIRDARRQQEPVIGYGERCKDGSTVVVTATPGETIMVTQRGSTLFTGSSTTLCCRPE